MRLGARPPLSQPDALESARLELVALAAEVATLATRVQEESGPGLTPDDLDAVLAGAEDLHQKAAQVLAFDSRLHGTDMGELQAWLATFRGHQRQAALLRTRAARQRTGRPRAALRAFTDFFDAG